jgi:hypothetical protein
LVYNSSTSKWENSSAGYVPYTGAVTTVNLGAQSILAGSFVRAGGTSAQFLKADGSVDSSTYGTGTVTSVALTMPTAFSVANSPVTTAGTLAVTATGTTAQYIRGDGSLATFPGLTGFVPYTGATADVNLGTHDLLAERGTFANNGSSDTLTVNHTSGSGYGIIVTKGGANEALYVSKTSGSGNAMTVVGGRTSLVDLALSSVTNTAGDFLTLSGGVVHKRTAAQTLTDIGGQAALTNPVTGTGTTNYLPKFTGTSTIGNSAVTDDGTTVTLASRALSGTSATFSALLTGNSGTANNTNAITIAAATSAKPHIGSGFGATFIQNNHYYNGSSYVYDDNTIGTSYITLADIIAFGTGVANTTPTTKMTLTNAGRLLINTQSESTFQLDVNGTGRFSGAMNIQRASVGATTTLQFNNEAGANRAKIVFGGSVEELGFYAGDGSAVNLTIASTGAATFSGTGDDIVIIGKATASQNAYLQLNAGSAANAYINSIGSGNLILGANGAASNHLNITSGGNVGINVTPTSGNRFWVKGSSTSSGDSTILAQDSAGTNLFYVLNNGNVVMPNGNVLIGTTSQLQSTERLAITTSSNTAILAQFTGGATSGWAAKFWNNATSGDNLFIEFATETSINARGSVTYNRGSGLTVFNTVSDYRLKTEISDFNSLSIISNLKPKEFRIGNATRKAIGFIAHELQEYFPQAVSGIKDQINILGNPIYQSVDYSQLTALLTKAIQELKEEIDILKQKS